jgi:hypothetical protein
MSPQKNQKNHMSDKELSRRNFLMRSAVLGSAALGSGALLAACGGGAEEAAPVMEEAPADEAMAGEEAAVSCNDLTGLTDAEIEMRNTLQYVDVSEFPDKVCDNCQLYIVPEEGAVCGGCQIIKGPVAPKGYCASWAAKLS